LLVSATTANAFARSCTYATDKRNRFRRALAWCLVFAHLVQEQGASPLLLPN
jgi:hypothetical protein